MVSSGALFMNVKIIPVENTEGLDAFGGEMRIVSACAAGTR